MSKKHLRSHALNAASAFGLLALLLAAAGSKPSGASAGADGGTTTTTSADEDPTEPKVSVSGTKVPNFEYIRGTCENVKKAGQCDEYYGLIPKFSPDTCKTAGGNFVTSTPKPNPCPREKLIGTCHYEPRNSGDPGQFANYYATNARSAADLKKECNEHAALGGSKVEWIDPPAVPAAAATSAAPAAAAKVGAPAKTNATPAKAPAKAKTK